MRIGVAGTGGRERPGGGSFTGYGAYVIAGNAVLMCELELATCEALLDQLE